MELIYTHNEKIKSYDVDMTGKLKLSALFNWLQEAAYNHANILKVGYHDLISKNKFWVLSRIKMRIDRYPKWDEEIQIHTWPKIVEKISSTRDFRICDHNHEPIISATSVWVILDSNTKQIQRLNTLGYQIPILTDKYAIMEAPGKICKAENIQPVLTQQVYYNDLDVNKHVNNAKYIEWLTNAFPENFYLENEISELQINFLSEAFYNDSIQINMGKNTDCYMECISKKSGNVITQAHLVWRKC